MTTFKIFDSFGKSITFRGKRVASARSRPIQLPRGYAWFELDAYRSEKQRWIVVIVAHRESDCDEHEVILFYETLRAESVEDFLFDFDPAVILPAHVLDEHYLSSNQAVLVATDHVFFASAMQLGRELKSRDSRSRPESSKSSIPLVTEWNPIGGDKNSVIHRLRNWFGM